MEQKPIPSNPNPVDVTKKDRFAGIKEFLKKRPPKKRLMMVGGIAGAVLLIGGAMAFTLIEPSEELYEPDVVSTYVPPPEPVYSALTGIETTEELAARPVTGAMIENSIDARPQSGLQEAGIVYEAIAEGGITRFLALYQEAKPDNIGPIRSARPYYVRWAAGYDARYLHSGGSGAALALIRSLDMKDLDHGKYGNQIASRVSNRYAPHNVYTSMDRIDSLSKELGYTSSKFTGFERKEDDKPTAESPATASRIEFNISSANYNTYYTYDEDKNEYSRFMAGLPHKDQESGKQIKPKVVIGLVMSYGIHSNRIHSIYENVGSGEAFIFQDGKVTKATWKKASDTAALELEDANGDPIELNAGQKWVTAIPSGRIKYTP